MIPRHILAFMVLIFVSSNLLASSATDFETQTITIALPQEPPQLSSVKSTDQVSIMILGHVMEGLTRYDRRGKVIPGVAERWEVNDKEATFWLRKDALWNDGEPVTAHDFVFAWQTALKPETASEYAFILYPLLNGEAINKGELDASELGVQAVDDYTLKIQFERPTGYFEKLTAFVSYLPLRRDFFESKGARYAADAKDLLYNGPFVIDDWVHSASLHMTKNQQYWDKDSLFVSFICEFRFLYLYNYLIFSDFLNCP